MTDDLLEQYKILHKFDHEFRGVAVGPYLPRIKEVIDETGAKTLLDYGCGKARQYLERGGAKFLGIMPTLYDPAYPPFAKKPEGYFDGVICTDVLEHIRDPIAFADEVADYATKFVFFSISCLPSRRNLPNGVPRHVSVHPPQWWRERLGQVEKLSGLRLELAFDVPET